MDSSTQVCVKILKDWLLQQPHLPHDVPDNFLMKCYIASNNSVELSKNLLDLFFTTRSRASEIFKNRNLDDPDIKATINDTIYSFRLPHKKGNNQIFVFGLTSDDADKFNCAATLKVFTIYDDVNFFIEEIPYDGEYVIIDMEKTTLKMVTKLSLLLVKKMIDYFQDSRPSKLKGIHFIHTPPFIEKIMIIIKNFAKAELINLIVPHQNVDTLYDYIPKEDLPKEYGGTQGTIEEHKKEWLSLIRKYRDLFENDDRWKVDESKRPKGNPFGEQYGVQGSFRTLDID